MHLSTLCLLLASATFHITSSNPTSLLPRQDVDSLTPSHDDPNSTPPTTRALSKRTDVPAFWNSDNAATSPFQLATTTISSVFPAVIIGALHHLEHRPTQWVKRMWRRHGLYTIDNKKVVITLELTGLAIEAALGNALAYAINAILTHLIANDVAIWVPLHGAAAKRDGEVGDERTAGLQLRNRKVKVKLEEHATRPQKYKSQVEILIKITQSDLDKQPKDGEWL